MENHLGNHLTINEFRKKYGSDSACLQALIDLRVSDRLCINPRCRRSIDIYWHPLKGRRGYICSSCLHQFYPMSKSLMAHSQEPPSEWFEIMYLMINRKNGLPANEIARTFGYSYCTAHRILLAIRAQMRMCLDFEFANTVVEVDESYVKTGRKGLTRRFISKKGRGSEHHTTILTIVERRGRALLIPVPSSDAESLLPIIVQKVHKSSTIFTDDWGAYNQLRALGYEHSTVNHRMRIFVDGSSSTNAAENLFSNAKRIINGTYRNVSEQNLPGVLDEISFRFSFRFEYDGGLLILLKSIPPLTYGYRYVVNQGSTQQIPVNL